MHNQKPVVATWLFDGTIQTASPFSTCSPAQAKARSKHAPLPVPKIRTPNGSRMYMPGTGLRSRLRGALTRLATAYAAGIGVRQLSLRDAQVLRLGGIKQAGAEATVDPVALAEALRKNPVLRLFGSSTPWIAGSLMVGHAIDSRVIEPGIWEPLVTDGVRADISRRDPDLLSSLEAGALSELQEVAAKVKLYSERKRQIRSMDQAIKAGKTAAERTELRKERDALVNESKQFQIVSAQQPLDGFESIPAGAELSHAMRLLNGSTLELGALLAALDGMAEQPLGAHAAVGNGELDAQWLVRTRDGAVGRIAVRTFEGLSIVEDPAGTLAAALAEFHSALAKPGLDFYALESVTVGNEGDEDADN